MALDTADRIKISMMRIDSPKVADLIVSMDKSYGDLPAMKQVNATFADLASKNTDQLKKLNEALEKNPGLADKIKANLGKNPEAFRTQFLPAVFKNPENALALADQAASPKPAAPAPFQKSYGDAPAVNPIHAAAPAPAAAAGAPAGSAKPQSADERLNAKLNALGKAEGFNDLMDRVDKNPELGAAMKAVMASSGSVADREQSVDVLLQKTKENPLFFKNIVSQIDTFPGAVSGIASQIAGDPKNALSKLSEFGEGGGMGAGMGMIAKMFSGGGMGGMGGILNMIMSFMKMIMGAFSGSSNHLIVGGNNGTEQYDQTVKLSPQNPDRKVAVITPTGEVISGSQAQAQSKQPEQNKAILTQQASQPA